MKTNITESDPFALTQAIRDDALGNGAIDPSGLRFRIVEYRKGSDQLVRVLAHDLCFPAAIEEAMKLMHTRGESRFCLQPVGFVQ
jgi:hypothetical protein